MSIEQSLMPATPTRVGQQTHVEQARALAEVAAMVQVAQQCPRNLENARVQMRRECSEFKTADTAFFRYSRGGKTVTGPTVKLARALKRCFGNFQSGWSELRRDDEYGQSEMQSWAWDIEANSRSVVTYVVPHANYYTGSPVTALRDVYENNANQGARREREMILGLLPAWFVEEAIGICRETLVKGNGEPLTVRQDKAEAALKSLGVELSRVERKIGRVKAQWSPFDLAELTVDYQSIKSGEIRAEEVFPPTDLQVEDLAPVRPASATQQQQGAGTVAWPAQAAQAPAAAQVAERLAAPAATSPVAEASAAAPADRRVVTGPALKTAPGTVTSRQIVALNARFAEMPVRGRGQAYARARVARALAGRDSIDVLTSLSEDEAALVINMLVGDAGVAAVVDILTEDGAPAELIPQLPQAGPAPAQASPDAAPAAPAAPAGSAGEVAREALEQHFGAGSVDPGDEDPALTVDPTTEPGWPGDEDYGAGAGAGA